jgi:hypothetical protein
MSSPLSAAITDLSSADPNIRRAAAEEIYDTGRALANSATQGWRKHADFRDLLGSEPVITVGLAVDPDIFASIRQANGSPRLAEVPPDQDAEEFDLHFPEQISLDVLTTRDPGGAGAIARYLAKFGDGIQQVEYRCADVDRATAILQREFGLMPIYAQTRAGADNTRINFFLVAAPEGRKVLIELYEPAKT